MAEKKPQNFANHPRVVPLYHFVLSLMLLVNMGWTGWRVYKNPGAEQLIALMLAVAFVLLYYFTRAFPLHVQDRLIRLEERLRLAEALPQELAKRIPELTPDQLIGLRFAPDEELPGLVSRVLAGELTGRQEIKKAVEVWRPDHYRC